MQDATQTGWCSRGSGLVHSGLYGYRLPQWEKLAGHIGHLSPLFSEQFLNLLSCEFDLWYAAVPTRLVLLLLGSKKGCKYHIICVNIMPLRGRNDYS